MPSTALTPRVAVDTVEPSTRATLTISADGFVTRFALGVTPPRLRVGMVLSPRSEPVDVSAQPTVLASALGPASPEAHRDAEQLADWVAGFCDQHRLWASPERDLSRVLTGAAFPLLAHLYGRGASTLGEVPRWATGALAEATPRAAASVLLGRAVSRSVVAALARSLLPERVAASPAALLPLSLALMGRSVLPADALVRVLRSADDRSHDPAELPTVDDIGRMRLLGSWMGPRRIERMLTDAGSLPEGPRLLARMPCSSRAFQRVRVCVYRSVSARFMSAAVSSRRSIPGRAHPRPGSPRACASPHPGPAHDRFGSRATLSSRRPPPAARAVPRMRWTTGPRSVAYMAGCSRRAFDWCCLGLSRS